MPVIILLRNYSSFLDMKIKQKCHFSNSLKLIGLHLFPIAVEEIQSQIKTNCDFRQCLLTVYLFGKVNISINCIFNIFASLNATNEFQPFFSIEHFTEILDRDL